MIKKLVAAVAVLSVTLLSGCNISDGHESSGGVSVPSYTTDETSESEPVEDSSQGGESTSSAEQSDPPISSSEENSTSTENSTTDETSSSTTFSSSLQTSSSSTSTKVPSSSSSTTSSSKLPSSSSSSKEDPPPVVVVPNFPVPTSPGTKVASASNGWVDYSNSSDGYISAKYTGSKSKVKIQILSDGQTPYTHDVTPGVVEYYPLSLGSREYTVKLCENISGTSYTPIVTVTFSANTNSTKAFLYPTHYSYYNSSSSCVLKAAELCAGKKGTIDKIAAVFGWVTSNVKYDYDLAATVKSGYVPNPDRTFKSKKGICFDYASLMCAMLRSQNIPTRLVVGYTSSGTYHAWNEIYTEETGWVTPEIMFKKAGYNLIDSTFYSTAKDKAYIGAYIMNTSNYSVTYYY